MHRQINIASEQGVFDFFDEEPFAAGIRQLGFLESIAGRLDDDDAARRTARGGYTGRDSVGLPQRELAAA